MAACHSRCSSSWWTNGSRACAPRPEPPGGGRRSEAQTDRDRNELERLRRGLDAGVARLDEKRRPLQAERHADAAIPAGARGRVGSHHGVARAGIATAPPRVADIAIAVLGELHLGVIGADPTDQVAISGWTEEVLCLEIQTRGPDVRPAAGDIQSGGHRSLVEQ